MFYIRGLARLRRGLKDTDFSQGIGYAYDLGRRNTLHLLLFYISFFPVGFFEFIDLRVHRGWDGHIWGRPTGHSLGVRQATQVIRLVGSNDNVSSARSNDRRSPKRWMDLRVAIQEDRLGRGLQAVQSIKGRQKGLQRSTKAHSDGSSGVHSHHTKKPHQREPGTACGRHRQVAPNEGGWQKERGSLGRPSCSAWSEAESCTTGAGRGGVRCVEGREGEKGGGGGRAGREQKAGAGWRGCTARRPPAAAHAEWTPRGRTAAADGIVCLCIKQRPRTSALAYATGNMRWPPD